jgi:thiol-disulfide isomerase/thioredoxin
MANTPSVMIPLSSAAPAFNLPDTVSGKEMSLLQLKGSVATMIMFICNHCPFVKHVNAELIKIANEYTSKGIGFIAISSNDVDTHPEDGPELIKKVANDLKYPFPYLYDETQKVARAYDAACTPDFYIYDKDLKLAYRGQLDDSRPGNGVPVTGHAIRNALEQLINGKPVPANQKPSIGCSIKWKI